MEYGCFKSSAILSVITIVFIGLGDGERFYQYRDHRDQGMFAKQTGSLAVHNKLEAEQQLEKYGYLHCSIQQRRKRSFFPDFLSEGPANSDLSPVEGDLPPCSRREIRKAIKQYQKTYKLPQTGVLDKRTRTLMSTSRCGNADKDKNVEDKLKEGKHKTSTIELLDQFLKQNSQNKPDSLGKTLKNRPWKRSASNTQLMQVIAGKDPVPSLERRRRYLHDYINKIKHEDPMMYRNDNNEQIISVKKRSVAVHEYIDNSTVPRLDDGQRFEKQVIKWRLLDTGYSTRIPVDDQKATIDLAFRMWSEVIPLKFVEETDGDVISVDIEVAFGKGAHQNCKRNFDGHGGEIAHSFSTGNMHFDDDEYFKSMRTFTPDGIYLLRVAVHEIGHVLGLMHTDKKYSIMYAIYEKGSSNPDFELGWEDRKAVQAVYGVCKGRFNTVFDWVRKRPDNQFIFNTYFFRGNHYWMYENHANRTRYGDPLYITNEWGGIPDEPDGYAHIWYFSGSTVVDEAYFFKGENVYKYNSEKDEIFEGWPKLIQEEFGAKPGETDTIPNNLDTVFFDMRDKNLYFFKDDMVYVFDPKEPKETRGCCVRQKKITEEFPSIEGDKPLPANLDSVYYSYKDTAMYFIRDEEVWQNVLFHPRQKHVKNSVKYLGNWYEKWFDICDVTTHSTYMFDFKSVT